MQLIERPHYRDWMTRIPIPEAYKDARENTHLKLQVEYAKGGTNYFSGAQVPRGFRIGFRRVQCKDGYMESFLLFGGDPMDSGYIMLEPAARYNAARLRYWAEKVEDILADIGDAIMARDKTRALTIAQGLGAKSAAPLPLAPVPVKELLTESLRKELLAAGLDGQKAVCKFFNPCGGETWIVSGMDSDNDTLWCLADLGMDCCEQGTVSLSELQTTKLPLAGLHIERDLHFNPRGRTLSDFYKIYEERKTLQGVS